MLATDTLLTFVSASLLLALVPGPDNLFVLSQSMFRGKSAGLAITLGLCTGLILHTALVVFGVAVIIQTSELAFTLLKVLGASYLLYLAWRFLRASPIEKGEAAVGLINLAQLYRRGIIMNISNPKVSLFFLAFLPQFVEPAATHPTLQLIMLGGLFMLSALLVFGGIAFLAEFAGNWLIHSVRAQKIINHLASGLFVVLALKLITAER